VVFSLLEVEIDAFFFYIGKEVMAFGDSLFYFGEGMVDDAVWRFDLICGIDGFFYAIVCVEIFGCFFGFGSDEYIEVRFIDMGNIAFEVGVLDPFVAGVTAEKDYHSHVRHFFKDDISYNFQLILFLFRQMC